MSWIFVHNGGVADLDFDGDVDGGDFFTLVRVYGNACP